MQGVFLDVRGTVSIGKDTEYDLCVLTESCLENLAKIRAAYPDLTVIVTSSFRTREVNMSRITTYLRRKAGFDREKIKVTPNFGLRGEEIRAWLKANPHIKKWIILDDETVRDEKGQVENQIYVNSREGLTEEVAAYAIQKLL